MCEGDNTVGLARRIPRTTREDRTTHEKLLSEVRVDQVVAPSIPDPGRTPDPGGVRPRGTEASADADLVERIDALEAPRDPVH